MTFLFIALVVILGLLIVKVVLGKNRIQQKKRFNRRPVVGLFHPYCSAGGGEERVLWRAVRSIQIEYPGFQIVVYTGDRVSSETMLQTSKQKFNGEIREGNLEFITLRSRQLVEATNYPHFTLIGQSLGSMVLGMEAICKLVPDIFIDTMGYSFTFPIFRYLGGCKIACYVHYPTISTDMLSKVASGTTAFNNSSFISKSSILTQLNPSTITSLLGCTASWEDGPMSSWSIPAGRRSTSIQFGKIL